MPSCSTTELLTAVRAATGATLQEIADLAGLSWGTVWRVERGMRPSTDSVEKLERALSLALERSKARVAAVEAQVAAGPLVAVAGTPPAGRSTSES